MCTFSTKLNSVSLIAVGLCWGGTNPIIRKNSRSIIKVEASSAVGQFLLDVKYLATNIWVNKLFYSFVRLL
nr:unnamed protein product [Callosobruchus chinensis]